ncbi:MAG: CDP-alcohol phosphatidyltransferase family protein [Spirochaetes bacterium]|nr:MAG: CDP-alcohol phosphatidyltransferase family protein [Spirochaetota bacterium]
MQIKDLLSGRVFTLSNFLSISRILLSPFVGYMFHMEKATGDVTYRLYSLGLICIIIATDFLDGFLARALNQVSRLGQFIDPLADKITAIIMGALVCYYKEFPLWVLLAVMTRDAYSVIGGILLFTRKDIQGRPNMFGKMMVVSIGFSGLIYVLETHVEILGISLRHISIFLILFFLVLSTLEYWRTYSKVYFEKKR